VCIPPDLRRTRGGEEEVRGEGEEEEEEEEGEEEQRRKRNIGGASRGIHDDESHIHSVKDYVAASGKGAKSWSRRVKEKRARSSSRSANTGEAGTKGDGNVILLLKGTAGRTEETREKAKKWTDTGIIGGERTRDQGK